MLVTSFCRLVSAHAARISQGSSVQVGQNPAGKLGIDARDIINLADV